LAAGEESGKIEDALARSQFKKDGGFKNNWSFDDTEESEGDAEKDDANLFSIEEDNESDTSEGKKSQHCRSEAVGTSSGDFLKTYVRRNKIGSFRTLKGNSMGLNMLSNNKKLSENAKTLSICSGTIVHGRRFHHANAQIPVVKTAAQSIKNNFCSYLPLESIIEKTEESESESESEIKRKVQPKRHCNSYQSDFQLSPASKKSLTHLEDLQRNCRQALNEAAVPLSRTSIHHNSGGQKSQNTGLNAKKFYGNTLGKVPVDIIVSHDYVGQNFLQSNGKIILPGAKIPQITNLRKRNTKPSDLNDPIILSSDDEDDIDNGNTNRRESISPRPADSARSSPAPSTGKVEAALKENSCGIEHRMRSTATESDLVVTIPRKARMKDQFGNSVPNTPLKRRKVTSPETLIDTTPLNFQSHFESVILNCRSIRIGTLRRMVAEPVIVSTFFLFESGDIQEIDLKTSELTKCEWCSVRKLPVVFLQTIPAACHSLRMQLKMSRERDNSWYDCEGESPEEQYIILIFETGLDTQANIVFENIITEIGIRNNIPDFFVKISFEEANGRLVAFTKTYEEVSKASSLQKESKIKNVSFEPKIQLRNVTSQFQFFDEEEEIGEPHTVFIGPIQKLIVYPPPPAKGGICVTNEDLHCLNEGEFLNDVIIDFYLKYLVLEKLNKEDADRIHIFSSFFYKRLNQRERRNLHETTNLSIQQKRHGRVKTWTRHVDIFEKDFIFVPLNEAAHWFLAVVCFPGLEKPKYEPNPQYHENIANQKGSTVEDSCTSSSSSNEMDSLQNSPAKPVIKKIPNKKQNMALIDSSIISEESDLYCRRSSYSGKSILKKTNHIECETKVESACQKLNNRTKDENGMQNEFLPSHHTDGLNRIRLNYSDEPTDIGNKLLEDELIDFSEDQDNQEDSSDDGGLDDTCSSELGQWHLKPTICKQPCILLMDSLRGPSRSNVVKTLREYLEVEWEVRKGSKRSFSKDLMKGSNPKVPQQNNFSDCGVYVLQYVESFFENPILNFELPMNLTDWFPRPRMKTKREEIRNIILKLQEEQSKEKKGHRDINLSEASLQEKADQYINSSSD
uniref:Sentrin-specific protease 6 n=1 Tax=Monodelphis domestica TaxID=13616 RepID=A0A5F8G8K4_MONDO